MISQYDNLVPRLEVLKGTGIKINSALDIGANTGQWFSLFTSIFTQTKVTSVEDSPATYEILKNTNPNSILSCLGNPTSNNQTVDFWISPYSETCTGSSYYKEDTPWYKDSYKKTLPLEKLDNLFPNSVFDYVKIDTQGSELDIILGGKTLIEKAMVVECEVSILDYNPGGCLFYDIMRIMDELGFRVFDYTASYYWNNRLNQMNLIFLKKNNPLFMLENDTIPQIEEKDNSRNLVVVINAYPNFDPEDNAIESIRNAAARWSSDFLEIRKLESGVNLPDKLLRTRLYILSNFKNYEKILIVDSDVIINSKAKNIFEIYPDVELGGVLDGNPSRFPGNWFKDTIVRNNSYMINDEFLKAINLERSLYFDNYINVGVLLANPNKISEEIEKCIHFYESNKELQIECQKNFFGDQNFLNILFCLFIKNLTIMDDTWNWIAPDIAGYGGNISDYFDPNTGELLTWYPEPGIPPNWADSIFNGPMHPNIYHFCGTDGSKSLCKTYKSWK